ncbi:hypothetical protein F8M41_018434 [Gigaspora margarita]|uniref:Uncharacterized protein n=1 Tax=Gigaspora margarita TaxID=4874 RepID=A0A8H4ALI6_GIGMA|nr:hypothetical protein F8M41_018434 [Gigaspora margarita]
MKDKLDKELQYFINEIINNLLAKKQQKPNEIDKLIEKQNNITNKIKKCLQCFILDIDNKTCNCPNCNAKLPILTSINQASSSQQLLELENINKEIIFKPYELKKQSESNIKLQQSRIINVQKVLEHIEIIAGIKYGKRKWIPVVCDGVLYNQALKLRKKLFMANFTSRTST